MSNLDCLNNIITDHLAIHIDITKTNSWNLNTGLTLCSLTKLNNAISDDLILYDFGLTAYDNGRLNKMYSGITLTQNDNKFKLYRIGVNDSSGNTNYSGFTISSVSGSSVGRYFNLSGGCLQGFFKLQGYNYELLSPRYNKGITIETILEILPQSEGIFFYMGSRAEDKYNPFFSGETTILNKNTVLYGGNKTGFTYLFSGVTTSENNYLVSYEKTGVTLSSFRQPEYSDIVISDVVNQFENINNNIIAFEITNDKKLKYKYINENGILIENESTYPIKRIGWTIIDIVYKPYDYIVDFDNTIYNCYPRRKGDLIFYINGRIFWKIKEFDEFYFTGINNDKEKQLGVPYNITWGGGSFGLKNSWHYDNKRYFIYSGDNTSYISNNFFIQDDPIPSNCYTPNNNYLAGLSLSANSSAFTTTNICNPSIKIPLTVINVEYTGITGTSAMTYFIKYNQPISVLSNRDYEINASILNNGFFKTISDNFYVNNKISIIVYGSTDIDIISEIDYEYPIIFNSCMNLLNTELHPFPDRSEYEYIGLDHHMYYGATGVRVTHQNILLNQQNVVLDSNFVTGQNEWVDLKTVFRTADNSGKQQVFIGILIESTDSFNINQPLYISDFSYKGADILNKDINKDNLFVEKYFNSTFIGNLQKLRVYDIALKPDEVLHNAIFETKYTTGYGINISTGGRIIQRYENITYIPQQTSGSDIRKSIRYRNADGSYKDLFQMIDIKVVVKSRSNPSVELVKFKKVADIGWLALIFVDTTTYDFIVPDTITSQHPNEVLFAEIKFQWVDLNDIDGVADKIFVVDITTTNLLNNTVKNY